MSYVDGFVIPVPKKRLAEYMLMAKKAGKIWMEHGAVEYRECVGDDLKVKGPFKYRPFPEMAKTKSGETVVFSWIVYKSKAHRNAVNKKVMKDPRLMTLCDPHDMPFDAKRMAYAGFKAHVDLQK